MQIAQKDLKKKIIYKPGTGRFFSIKAKGLFELIPQWKRGSEIPRLRISGILYRASRLAYLYMEGDHPTGKIITKNNNNADLRYENLEMISAQEVCRRVKQKSTNKSGVTGVSSHSTSSKWVATITVDWKIVYLGLHTHLIDAATARLAAEIEYGFLVDRPGSAYRFLQRRKRSKDKSICDLINAIRLEKGIGSWQDPTITGTFE
ncbi:MAG: hypothetical protein DRJ03_07470 [Chloroflexi bacterium]|nr:MAG: hypothetical protein DRJ03_07470 [Chloroflexota bacterium]